MKCLLFVFCIFGLSQTALAQDSLKSKETLNAKKGYAAPSATARELSNSLEQKDYRKSAVLYEKLAKEFEKKEDYAKSELYYKQALNFYTAQKNKKKLAEINRYIARIQELQNKINEAISSYEMAAKHAGNFEEAYINSNDADRLKYSSELQEQRSSINANIKLLKETNQPEQLADAYSQLAEVELKDDKSQAAVEKLEIAIKNTTDEEKKSDLKDKIAATYAADKDYVNALKISAQIYEDAKAKNNISKQIQQLKQQAIYHTALGNKNNKSLTLLLEAYRLAIESNNTFAAKSVTESIVTYFSKKNDYDAAIKYYQIFLQDLDSLILKDSNIVEEKLLLLTENRIRELENERELQMQIIKNKNVFNYFLIGSIALMVILLLLIVKSLFAIKVKNKKIALQSLRREMNPHFIFNSLNSVNQFIAENNELQANKYLTSYSTLMRNMMEHSNKDFVSLSVENEHLQQYLELEHLRFKHKFDFKILIDENIDTDVTFIPNMLIQPQLENAIWHGLRYKDTKGNLSLEFTKSKNKIKAIITDDGIGISQSQALKTFHQKTYKSIGINNTKERINLLNELYKTDISIEITERKGENTGTIVTLTFPIIDKKYAQR